MDKLQIFWKSRKTWIYAFYEWYYLMYPHLRYGKKWIYDEIDEKDNAYWFFESLNNYGNIFDEWGIGKLMKKKLNFFEQIWCGWIHIIDLFLLWKEIVFNTDGSQVGVFFRYIQHDYIDYVETTWWRGQVYNKLGIRICRRINSNYN